MNELEPLDFVRKEIRDTNSKLTTENQRIFIGSHIWGGFQNVSGIDELKKAFPKKIKMVSGCEGTLPIDQAPKLFNEWLKTQPRKLGTYLVSAIMNREYGQFLNALVQAGYLHKDEKGGAV